MAATLGGDCIWTGLFQFPSVRVPRSSAVKPGLSRKIQITSNPQVLENSFEVDKNFGGKISRELSLARTQTRIQQPSPTFGFLGR